MTATTPPTPAPADAWTNDAHAALLGLMEERGVSFTQMAVQLG